jgi:hypothetical protein
VRKEKCYDLRRSSDAVRIVKSVSFDGKASSMKMTDSFVGYSASGLVEVDRRFRGAYCLHHHGMMQTLRGSPENDRAGVQCQMRAVKLKHCQSG